MRLPDAKSAVEIESSFGDPIPIKTRSLDGELFVALVCWFVSDVGDAGFRLINVEDRSFTVACSTFVRRQRASALPVGLWGADLRKAGCIWAEHSVLVDPMSASAERGRQ